MRWGGWWITAINPAIRKIAREAAAQDYRWSAIISGIVQERAVPVDGCDRRWPARALRSVGEPRHVHHEESVSRAAPCFRGMGATRRVAAARFDGAGDDRARADGGEAGRRDSARSTCPTASSRRSGIPTTEGAGFEFTPTLKPLEPFRDRLLVVSGLDSVPPPPPGERQFNNHADASTRFLTDTTPGRAVRAGISVDQLIAKACGPGHRAAVARDRARIGGLRCDLRLRSQLRLYRHDFVGRSGIAAADGAVAERRLRAPVRRQRHHRCRRAPRADARARQHSRFAGGAKSASLRGRVSPADRSKISGYLESVRDVERRIARAIAHNAEVPVVNRPAGQPGIVRASTPS